MSLVPIPRIPDVPEFPELGDPAFNNKAFTWGSAMPGVSNGMQGVADAAYLNAQEALDASEAAVRAAESVALVANVTKWAAGTPYAEGRTVWSPNNSQTYRARQAVNSSVDPANDPTNWALLGVQLPQLYAASLSI